MDYFDNYTVKYMILSNRIPNWREFTSPFMFTFIKSTKLENKAIVYL